jgi:hypothetical protein
MMRSRRLVALAVAMAVPLTATLVLAGPAGAKKVVATGTVTCHVSQTFTFNPAMTGLPAGTPGFAVDLITISPAQLSQCSGTPTPTNALPSTGAGSRTIVVKWKGVKIGVPPTFSAGGCPMIPSISWAKVKPHLNWSAFPTGLKSTKISNVQASPAALNGEQGFIFTGVARGSFAGPVTLSDYFDAASTAALVACKANTGTVSSLTTDPANSTITLGTSGP